MEQNNDSYFNSHVDNGLYLGVWGNQARLLRNHVRPFAESEKKIPSTLKP